MSTMLRIDNAQLNGNLQPTLSSASGLPDVSAASVANTLSKLYSSGAASNAAVSLIPSHLIITPATASPPSAQVQDRLRDLTLTAHEAANELCCGSLLAGQGSETDEYGDIAIWLGEGPYADNALGVLSALGLEGFIDRADDPATTITLTPAGLLSSLQPSPPEPYLSKLSSLLSALDKKYAFFVKGGPATGGAVLHVLVGEVTTGDERGWGGMLGMGIWSDD